MTILKAQRLTIKLGSQIVLVDISFELPLKGLIAVIGANGSGKSTLLDAICGFVRPTAGCIECRNARHALSPRQRRRAIARLHQVLVLPEDLTVDSLLRLAMQPQDARFMFGPTMDRGNVLEAIQRVRPLVGRALMAASATPTNRMIGQLSWGQKRLVALAAVVLVPEKEFLLLDEPLAGFSGNAHRAIMDVLSDEGQRRLVIMAEHDLSAVGTLADMVLVLRSGRLVRTYSRGELEKEDLLKHWWSVEE